MRKRLRVSAPALRFNGDRSRCPMMHQRGAPLHPVNAFRRRSVCRSLFFSRLRMMVIWLNADYLKTVKEQ